jgi:hypothetical protein
MFKSVHSRARTVATVGVVAALAVAGVAVAQGGGGKSQGQGQGQGRPPSGKRMPPPGGPLGKVGRDLTNGQLHVQRNGEDESIRLDAGEVVSVSEDSITLKENDGNEVTIAVDEETKVLAGPGKKNASATDLKQGQQVIVCGPEGEAAKTIAVPPKRGQKPPPPPGGQFGGPQDGPGQMQG